MDRTEIKKNILSIASALFHIEESEIDEDLKAGNIESWDSLGHLTLFSEIERKFKVRFSTNEIVVLNSIRKIIDNIMKKKQI